MTQIGIIINPAPKLTAPLAVTLEDMGFDAMLCPDTQNICADPYSQLALAAAATKTIILGTGVTNPITRDPAVTASAMATLQIESDGRALCVIGRGDSSAAHIGKRKANSKELEAAVKAIQAYIRGEDVMIGDFKSTMRWISPGDIPPVPVDMAVTGPRTIRMAADIADQVSFAVGSSEERLDWAMDTLNTRLEETGRDRSSLKVGAFINLVCDRDEKRAIELARLDAGLVAHFSGMKDAPIEHLPKQLKRMAIRLKNEYDMKQHAQTTGSHLEMLDDEFVDWFSICGGPQKCIDRLGALIEKGLDHVYLIIGSPEAGSDPSMRAEAKADHLDLFAKEVMPVFHQ